MIVRIKNAGEEREAEDVISKKALERIVRNKDHQYLEMRQGLEHKLKEKNMEVGLHLHNEKNYLRIIKEKEHMIYYVGGLSYLIGGVCGWLIH